MPSAILAVGNSDKKDKFKVRIVLQECIFKVRWVLKVGLSNNH